jgi:hypothetical protein
VGKDDSCQDQGSESQSGRDTPRHVEGTDVEHAVEGCDLFQERNERLPDEIGGRDRHGLRGSVGVGETRVGVERLNNTVSSQVSAN